MPSVTVTLAPFSDVKPSEMMSFDLAPLRGYPQFAAIIDWVAQGANPPLCWGTMSSLQYIKRYKTYTVKQQLEGGVIGHAEQTPEQRDLEVMEEMRADLLMHAPYFEGGCSDELLRRFYELDFAYYEVAYTEGAPAQKSVKLPSVVTLVASPTKYQARVLRKFLATVKSDGSRVFPLRLTYSQRCWLMRRDWVESVKLDVDYGSANGARSATNFDALVVARDKLLTQLQQQFGETAYVKTLANPKYQRLGVYLRKDGLVAAVVLTAEEDRAGKSLVIGGKSYDEFLAPVPKEFGGFPVTLQVAHLDSSATEPPPDAVA